MFKHRNMPVLACKKAEMQENRLNKFRTIVSKVGNPVYKLDINVDNFEN